MKSLLFISGLDMIQIIINQKWFVKMSIFSPLVVTKKEYFIIITFLNRGVITKKKDTMEELLFDLKSNSSGLELCEICGRW